jgi:predicted secreted protein
MTTPKTVQVSDDAGATWHTLPGNAGAFNQEAGGIDDTIFGASFGSEEIGLINWTIDSQAFYKGFAGYHAKIKQQGASTPMLGEAMTLVSGQRYKITNAAKNIWNRMATFVVYDNAVDHTADVLSFNYLFGEVVFKPAYIVVGPVTVDGSFYPTTTLGKANAFTLGQSADTIETSDFATVQANGGFRTFIQGLKKASLDLTSFYDVTAGFRAALIARDELIVELDPAGTGESVARGFFKIGSEKQSGNVGALEEETTTLPLNVPELVEIPFGWQHFSTTLSQAVQIVLGAWETGGIIDVRYLYDGTNGVRGTAIITDMSLAGGIDNMNEFTVKFQGTAATTDVGTG